MPLRQSLLSFYRAHTSKGESVTQPPPLPRARPTLTRPASPTLSDTLSDSDPDTIVVLSYPLTQLPTPSESSLDVSIQDARAVSMKQVPKGRARRVSRRLTRNESQNGLIEDVGDESAKSRTVSGETLVNIDNASQSTLVKEGIAALDLTWNMTQLFAQEDKATDALQADVYDGLKLQEEKAAAKKAKMEENSRQWEERRKAAEKQASRRSSRIPGLDKAGEIVSNIANSVLGKRKERAPETTSGSRKSMGSIASSSLREPALKKRRVSEGATPSFEEPAQKEAPRQRQKKWLSSGLYAGQSRAFEGRLSESKNRRKSADTAQTVGENKTLPLPMYAGERLLQQGRDFKLPFDIFSPLPAGQPKPDEWRKVNKNVFVGDAAQAWRVSKYEEQSSCMCRPETGCDHNCMNRCMFYECDERNCNLTADQCGNRQFEVLRQRAKKGGKYNVGVEVIKTVDRGHGVRSNRTFDPNQIIVEYTGEIITQEECERRMKTMYKDNECYYLMLFDQNMIIDATRGSIARFVNHSCDPNCRMEKWTVNGKPRMALFAGDRGIMTGEELTYDYNFDPYSQKNVQVCRCGAWNCRGVLGPRPKEEAKKSAGSKLAGAKRKIAEVIEEGAHRLSKKAKLAPKAKVYRSASSIGSPAKVRKIKVMKKAVLRKQGSTPLVGLTRQPSKLRKLVADAKSKGKSSKQRIVSTTSSTVLIEKEDGHGHGTGTTATKPLSRSSSLRDKASSVKSRMVRTVRGAQSGRSRTIRPIMDVNGMDEEEL
ncbi:histone-lysine N-methyltransferase ASH1L [Capronia epimyces CBS 606.96]|uniref:Histone-lysine N-methyltransferase ASH1L n=1 Tax=Capronia epimyces CBS 606.96 TaxID=1182542 RepID=W9ZDL4_9EURO|nr:histone-lysine N-methyltransferase ASH1L [Capronia epimyces CBS 606.96]EXJ92609.1 histone-lysine N-methyltransferase ASH1L [Capronia epimyces CBS 606.96]